MIRRIALSALVLLSVAFGCTREPRAPEPPAAPDRELVTRFRSAVTAGYAALEADSLARALEIFRGLGEIAPASPYDEYHSACAYGRSGRTGDATTSLRRAIAKGYADLAEAESDPDLAAVREGSEWPALRAALQGAQEKARAELARALRELPSAAEPAFPTLDSLHSHYGALRQSAGFAGLVYGAPAAARLRVGGLSHELAALARFAGDHPEVSPHAILMARLAAQSRLPEIDGRPWTLGREQLLRTAEEILAQYPDSSGAAIAALWQVRGDWYGRLQGAVRDVPRSECDAVVERLREVAARYPGTPGGCEARVEALIVTAEHDGDDLDRLRPLLQELERDCGLDPRSQPEFGYKINELAMRVFGAPDFSAEDIDGRSWSLAALRGRHVLLDFWATWCGPCRAEIPRLVELAGKYAPEELQILGISLDRGPQVTPEMLRGWASERGMGWPQIYDGAAWEGTLVRQYRVPAIPFPVLIAPDGRVLAAGEGARGEALEAALVASLGR